MAYNFDTTKQRSKIMKKIRSTETKAEIAFRKLLWSQGLRYRKNDKRLPGKPDIAISSSKVVIFIDGEFWHGYNWGDKKKKIKANRDYWIPKIERNMVRDRQYSRQLRKQGWSVLRFWEMDVKKDPEKCLRRVFRAIKIRGAKNAEI